MGQLIYDQFERDEHTYKYQLFWCFFQGFDRHSSWIFLAEYVCFFWMSMDMSMGMSTDLPGCLEDVFNGYIAEDTAPIELEYIGKIIYN